MSDFLTGLLRREPFSCPCGKTHAARLKEAVIRPGATEETASLLRKYGGGRAFILADENTLAAGGRLLAHLDAAGVPYTLFAYGAKRTEPDENAVGAAVLHFDRRCDALISLGSGVVTDVTKILAGLTGLPFFSYATAPSTDGYASSTSSVIRGGLKVSVDSRCPDVIIGDTDVLRAAPKEMLLAGLGDMLAKYVSVCEWRIGHIVTGEYYCEETAALIRRALKQCVDNADGILRGETAAVNAVTEGLILSGVAADWAGVSRPVSGVEHYFSHIWDMRALEFGDPFSLHGIQCGIGTLYALKGYARLRRMTPDRRTALDAFAAFDRPAWEQTLRALLGRAAEPMLASSGDERNDPDRHAARVEAILKHWPEILAVIDAELPPFESVSALLQKLGAPTTPEEIGLRSDQLPLIFKATRDIRNKYILSALCFDLGISDEIANCL